MPFVRTAVIKGTSQSQRQRIVEGIHQALVESIGMPEDELFNLVTDYDPEQFFYSRTFNGVDRSDHLIVIEITMRRGRSDAMKRELYKKIADNLGIQARVRPQDVFIFMHENDYSDWSVGFGRFAMALVQQPGSVAPQ
ncbi:tautomerase family protein [Pseudomonas sp. SWRI12]|uniref:Tautomerase family protein n=1 Tax=Pseudomonas zanjanensis TaxID=2745496 RepID=A0A923FK93_9PSED|nr:tautomerase family protein [Pseudomonas zanjanensis]MBV4497018.1 tautomerase family protein [Pseudomonas zanjanensis]